MIQFWEDEGDGEGVRQNSCGQHQELKLVIGITLTGNVDVADIGDIHQMQLTQSALTCEHHSVSMAPMKMR